MNEEDNQRNASLYPKIDATSMIAICVYERKLISMFSNTTLESIKQINKTAMYNIVAMLEAYNSQNYSKNLAKNMASIMQIYNNIETVNFKSVFTPELKSIISAFSRYDYTTAVNNISQSLTSLFSQEILEQIKILQTQWQEIFAKVYDSEKSLKETIDLIYQSIPSSEKTDVEDNLSHEDDDFVSSAEIHIAINEQLNNPEGFRKRVAHWSRKKVVKYVILWRLIAFLYSNFIQPYFQQNIGIPVTSYVVSNVKELPQKGAEIITKLKKGAEAIIVENTNYYYKVSFVDEDGVEKEGYVAKRNLKILDNDNLSDKISKNINEEQDAEHSNN